MRTFIAALALAVTFLTAPLSAQSRIASDFEIGRMEKLVAASRDFASQVSGRLNLGDLRRARNEISLARSEYAKAFEIAEHEQLDARSASDLARYAEATSYAALAQAKLGRDAAAFALLEESLRYTSDDAESWNLYASSMLVLGRPEKAVSASRNAVTIAEASLARSASVRTKLDVAIYQYALASALLESGDRREATSVLENVTTALRSKSFDELRRRVVREESFEVYSSARGDAEAYVSLLNRSQLRLASLYEESGDATRASTEYRKVLESRNDDATALTALARLAATRDERERLYAEAFDANPFSLALARQYQKHLAEQLPSSVDDSTTGGKVRAALVQLGRGQKRAARETLDALLAAFPTNQTLRTLRQEADASGAAFAMPSAEPLPEELLRLAQAFAAEAIAASDRARLDRTTFTNSVRFDPADASQPGQTVLASGRIGQLPFKFATPTAFAGEYDAAQPLRLTYRILGVTRDGAADTLLLEPLRLEKIP